MEKDRFYISTVDDCKLVELPRVINKRGSITPINNSIDIPFDIKRVYYLYDIPGGSHRGGHAHWALEQFIVAASGSFDVVLNDGKEQKRISLNRPYKALHIVPGIWRELENFSGGAICLVLASHVYDEDDYIRDYDEFIKMKSL